MPPWGKRAATAGSSKSPISRTSAVDSDPDTKDYLQNLMEINEERGNYPRAIECANG